MPAIFKFTTSRYAHENNTNISKDIVDTTLLYYYIWQAFYRPKYGVIARYIRVCPLNHAQNGYYGKKSMRIGVYGNDKCEQINDDTTTEIDDENNGDLMNNKSVAATIITITKPSDTYHRNCWAVNHRAEGVFSCSCYRCKSYKYDDRLRRKDMRNYFRKQTKDINRIGDYSLDRDAIIYDSRKR